jgi:hypothetical protein
VSRSTLNAEKITGKTNADQHSNWKSHDGAAPGCAPSRYSTLRR